MRHGTWSGWRRAANGEPEAEWTPLGTLGRSLEEALDAFRVPDPERRPLDLLRLTEDGIAQWFGFVRDDGDVVALPPLVAMAPCPSLHSATPDESYRAIARRCGADLGRAWELFAPRGDWRLWFAAQAGIEARRLAAVARAAARHALAAIPGEGAALDLGVLDEADAIGEGAMPPRDPQARLAQYAAVCPAPRADAWEAALTAVSLAYGCTVAAARAPSTALPPQPVLASLRASVRVAAYATELPGAPADPTLLRAGAQEDRAQAALVATHLPLGAVLLAGTEGFPMRLEDFGRGSFASAVRG